MQVMAERWRFVREARQRLVTFTELCALYGISWVTGYKWLNQRMNLGTRTRLEFDQRAAAHA
jgi:hypothetical protein